MMVRYLDWHEGTAYAEQWNSLAPTVFTTFDWQASWYDAYGGQEPVVVTCTDETGLLGLAAFQRQERRIRFLGDGTYDSDNLDFVYRDPKVVPELLKAARRLVGPFDILDLRAIQPFSPLTSTPLQGWLAYRFETPHPVIVLHGSWDDYLSTLAAKTRSELRRRLRKAEGRCKVVSCQTEEQLPAFLDTLQRLHGERWRSRGQEGAFALKRRSTFFDLVARRFLRRGWLKFSLLEIDAKEAAVEFGFTFRGTYSSLLAGFDPALSLECPALILRAHLLKMLIKEGVHYYDFLGGNEEHKYRSGACDLRFFNINATPRFSPASLWLAAKKFYRKTVAP